MGMYINLKQDNSSWKNKPQVEIHISHDDKENKSFFDTVPFY